MLTGHLTTHSLVSWFFCNFMAPLYIVSQVILYLTYHQRPGPTSARFRYGNLSGIWSLPLQVLSYMTASRVPLKYVYILHCQVLESVTSARYLGVDIYLSIDNPQPSFECYAPVICNPCPPPPHLWGLRGNDHLRLPTVPVSARLVILHKYTPWNLLL